MCNWFLFWFMGAVRNHWIEAESICKYIWTLRQTFQVEGSSFISEEITEQIHSRNLY